MDNLVKVQCFGIIWFQEWLPKIIRSGDVSILWIHPIIFLRFSYVLIKLYEYANLIISILYR